MRLSAFLSKKYNISRKYAKALIQNKKVFCGDDLVRSDISIDEGADYRAEVPVPDIRYNLGDYLLEAHEEAVFLFKPAGMHSERLTPADALCLDDIVQAEYPDYQLISRLDYPVDGVIAALKNGVERRAEKKKYLAWVYGDFPDGTAGVWDVDASKRLYVKAFPSKDGIAVYIERHDRAIIDGCTYSLVEVTLERAHRHQVRAVLAAKGYPIVGDTLYKDKSKSAIERILLHCYQVNLNSLSIRSRAYTDFSTHKYLDDFLRVK